MPHQNDTPLSAGPSPTDSERAMLAIMSIDAVADMVIWTAPDGRYVFVNKAGTALLGRSLDELRQLRVQDVDPAFDEARWRQHWDALKARGCIKLETSNTTKAGDVVPIEVSANYILFEGREYNFAIVRDISERKRAEARMQALNQEIYRLSVTDGLTGLTNRRRFDEVLSEELARRSASREPLSLILLDIDRFKPFNDRYGHVAGDACLRRVADAIGAVVNEPAWLAARYGGEEFACILPATGREAAAARAEAMRAGVAALAMAHADSPPDHVVTVSLGVATVEGRSSATPAELLRRADARLYEAKRSGRNRVMTEPCSP